VDDHVRATTLCQASGRGDVAVLAHWDADGDFAEASAVLLDGLRAAGLDVVVVSTSSRHETLVEKLEGRAVAAVTRDNIGFDFLSWARGLVLVRHAGMVDQRLVLINTSMYGPLAPMDGFLDSLWSLPADVLGVTESREFGKHLQSYLLAFRGDVIGSERFAAYWERIRPATNKWGTILAHEQRWARDLAKGGPSAAVLLPSNLTSCDRNPLTFTWRRVVAYGVPLIKRSLFLANPDRIEMKGWKEFIAEHASGFDPDVIDRDVYRLTGVHAP
jgi:lipopolysaccharide biosynthesis protein